MIKSIKKVATRLTRSVLLATVTSSLIIAAPAIARSKPLVQSGHNVSGAAVVGDSTQNTVTNPEASFQTDPYNFGDGLMGYILGATTNPTEFAGMNWPAVGDTPLNSTDAGVSAPSSVSFTFEVPYGSLSDKNNQKTSINPNLTIVVQDTKGDYYYAGPNQGITPSSPSANALKTYTQYQMTAAKGKFTLAGGTKALNILTGMAVVWSGWNTLGNNTPPFSNITQMFVSSPVITSKDSAIPPNPDNPHSPAGYTALPVDSKFNFQ